VVIQRGISQIRLKIGEESGKKKKEKEKNPSIFWQHAVKPIV
jgi:hypothetical protein